MFLIKSYLALQDGRFTAFTASNLLKKNQEEGLVKNTPHSTYQICFMTDSKTVIKKWKISWD